MTPDELRWRAAIVTAASSVTTIGITTQLVGMHMPADALADAAQVFERFAALLRAAPGVSPSDIENIINQSRDYRA